ncbi:hypothetical protein EMPS_03289 [Entomortierella parvispora]|uniref:Arrestin-like N-terminal domain-containing protein n=1 Tax=Entomortierella parvispora TaxID=205924 RepID=A0A9P3H6I0_9FUNG|nr:hypothetical protein EMPS_03289 [Entomortierella parvispora]
MLSKIFGSDVSKSLRVVILTPYRGPGNLPAIYATPEEQGRIQGYVEYECTEDIKGRDLDLAFRIKSVGRWSRQRGTTRVIYHSKEVLQRQTWDIPIAHSSQGVLSAGRTRYDFEVLLNYGTPSSISGRRSWLTYRFEATLHRGFPRRNITFQQDVWTFSTSLPQPHPDALSIPLVQSGIWESHLPFTCSIPNETVYLGQIVPLTIQFEPFVTSSGHLGQALVIVNAVVKFKQYTRLWHRWDVKHETKELLEMPVLTGWPITAHGFRRTLMVQLPDAPRLSCTTFTRPVQKTHCLKLIMKVKTASMTDREARELRIEMKVNVTAPRPEPPTEELPPYAPRWDGHDDGDDADDQSD